MHHERTLILRRAATLGEGKGLEAIKLSFGLASSIAGTSLMAEV